MPTLGRDELAWVHAAQAGSLSDFEALFRDHWPRAYRAAYLVAQDRPAAEEITLEAFLAAIRTLHSFDGDRPFGPWLHRLVVGRAVDRARARLSEQAARGEAYAESTEPLGWIIPTGPHLEPSAGLLARALALLSPELRAAVVLRHVLEYTPEEIADVLEVPRATVNARLRQGLGELERQLEGSA